MASIQGPRLLFYWKILFLLWWLTWGKRDSRFALSQTMHLFKVKQTNKSFFWYLIFIIIEILVLKKKKSRIRWESQIKSPSRYSIEGFVLNFKSHWLAFRVQTKRLWSRENSRNSTIMTIKAISSGKHWLEIFALWLWSGCLFSDSSILLHKTKVSLCSGQRQISTIQIILNRMSKPYPSTWQIWGIFHLTEHQNTQNQV